MSKQNEAKIETKKKLCRNIKFLVKVCLVLLLTTGCMKSEEERQIEGAIGGMAKVKVPVKSFDGI